MKSITFPRLSILLLLIASPSAFAWTSPIYGVDDRLELYQVADPLWLKLADSVVGVFNSIEGLSLDLATGSYLIQGPTLSEDHDLCVGARFENQIAAADCSGALVGPDLVLTAGHCIIDWDGCQSKKFAFGYGIKKEGESPKLLRASEVYSCAEIVAMSNDSEGADYAVIRLDRVVPNHAPLLLDRASTLAVGTALVAIGHPSGAPLKVARNAQVRGWRGSVRFTANLDTFRGNSGSPVFDAATGLIEGVLDSGDQDYAWNDAKECKIVKSCDDGGCSGEFVMRIGAALDALPSITSH